MNSLWAKITLASVCLVSAADVALPQTPVPNITLQPGELFFRFDGKPTFLPGTNPTGWMTSQFDTLLGWASQNERIVRIHLTNGKVPHPAHAGDVDEEWAAFWDTVFDTAAQNRLNVLPVFDVWAGWSTASAGQQSWRNNPYNQANGGPASQPSDLLANTPTRALWLKWLEKLIIRWQGRANIMGWEIFSELDLITGTTEDASVDFVENAAKVIRAVDTGGRRVTASLSGIKDWEKLSRSSVSFIQVHPYANISGYAGNLDSMILDKVRQRLTYGKPVFIGESGLDSRSPITFNTLTLSPRAPIAINQAIWAAAVSGAMNGRMLWFEDGYDQYPNNHYPNGDPLFLSAKYKSASAPVARFVEGVDYSGFQPLGLVAGGAVKGAALGNSEMVLGWVRDTLSVAPSWPTALVSAQTVIVAAPGQSHDWRVIFYDTNSGDPMQSVYTNRTPTGVSVTLPSFYGSIGFQMRAAIEVALDIKPGSLPNSINPKSRGVIPVAILTTRTAAGERIDFDASTVAPSSARFGRNSAAIAKPSNLEDVDGDGDLDLILHFSQDETGIACGDNLASMTGETFSGQPILASDSVMTVGCR